MLIAKRKNRLDQVKVQKALESMKTVIPTAEYYSLVGENVVLYYPTVEEDEPAYTINNKKYAAVGVGPFSYFKRINKETNQMKLEI